MSIILPIDKIEPCIQRALLFLEGLNLDINKESDINYALDFTKTTYDLCPDGKNCTKVEFKVNTGRDKVVLTSRSKRNVQQIIKGLKIFKQRLKDGV